MKTKVNISALLLALLVLVSSNGIALFEHICDSSKTKDYSFFSEINCEKEVKTTSCCNKPAIEESSNCCSHSQFFSKLSIEGFTAKQLKINSVEDFLIPFFNALAINILPSYIAQLHIGLPPPDNLYTTIIKSHLAPSSVKLQVFRC